MLHSPQAPVAAPAPPPAPLHTTSDLLRLLAADGHPFAAVAEAVAARFGAGAESRAWLARTLTTLLRVSLHGSGKQQVASGRQKTVGCRDGMPVQALLE